MEGCNRYNINTLSGEQGMAFNDAFGMSIDTIQGAIYCQSFAELSVLYSQNLQAEREQ